MKMTSSGARRCDHIPGGIKRSAGLAHVPSESDDQVSILAVLRRWFYLCSLGFARLHKSQDNPGQAVHRGCAFKCRGGPIVVALSHYHSPSFGTLSRPMTNDSNPKSREELMVCGFVPHLVDSFQQSDIIPFASCHIFKSSWNKFS